MAHAKSVTSEELDNETTRSGALFKPTAPLDVQTTGRREEEIHCRDRRISLQLVKDRSKIQYTTPIT